MFDGGENSSAAAAESFTTLGSAPAARKKKKNKNQRRFSDDQIKSLETMFESETKLEPRKKVQLAGELGLQPRQVAIWFQNKRARWKSKQMERDHSVLLNKYNSLASQFEMLKEEKQSLIMQLQSLNNLIQESTDKSSGKCESDDNGDAAKRELEANPTPEMERYEHKTGAPSDDDSSIKAEYFALEEEPTLLNMVEPAENSLTSVENWGNLEAEDLLDQSASSYQWWDFWS